MSPILRSALILSVGLATSALFAAGPTTQPSLGQHLKLRLEIMGKANHFIATTKDPYSEANAKLLAAIRKPAMDDDPAFTAALAKLVHPGTGKYADLKLESLNFSSFGFTGNANWNRGDKRVMYAYIFINGEATTAASYPDAKHIDGKYTVNDFKETGQNEQVTLRLGYFDIKLYFPDPALQGDGPAITELIRNVLDLEGFSAVRPE